jgi:uncharacterized protein YndB with AHSA1/START domain
MSDQDDVLVFEADLDAPPEKVWRAVATPQLREAWLGRPETGAAEVAGAEPGRRLDLVWPTREGKSLVSFEIDAGEDGGSRLTITHRPPAATARVVPLRPQARQAMACWRMAA